MKRYYKTFFWFRNHTQYCSDTGFTLYLLEITLSSILGPYGILGPNLAPLDTRQVPE